MISGLSLVDHYECTEDGQKRSEMLWPVVSAMGRRAPQHEQCSKRSLVDGRVGSQFMPIRLDLTSN